MTLAITLALLLLVGISLGLLGGGGSILTVPILVYVGGMDPKVAIAMSLLIVGVTSAVAAVAHARARRVEWRTAWLFGGAGMAGAYGGGQVARFLPAEALLLAFGVVMFVTAVAMLRRRAAAPVERPAGDRHLGRIIAEGAVVGAVTGLVGAGGGFLVVPALVLLGGLSMPKAVGTSLVVIALKSFAGLAGYLGHVSVDLGFALPASAIAVAGTLVGSRLVRHIAPETLRRAFGGFVAVMAVVLVAGGLPPALREAAWFRAVFVDRWPFWAGGAALAALVVAFVLVENKLLGVAAGCAELCAARRDPAARRSWRLRLLGGIVIGGLVAAQLAGVRPTLAMPGVDTLISSTLWIKWPVLVAAGALVGYGARLAGGCTTGHGIVGVALGARSSLYATALFLLGGFAATHLVIRLLGAGGLS